MLGTGTSQGVPVIGCQCRVCRSTDPKDKRTRVSILAESDTTSILVDISPDFRFQMLTADKSDVDGVLITHEHNDHTAGVDDIRPINFLHKKTIPFYAMSRVADQLRQRFAYAFEEEKYPGAPEIVLCEVGDTGFELGDIEVTPIHVFHGKLPILGYRLGSMAYLTDVKTLRAGEEAKLQNLDLLILNALRHAPHPTHLNLSEAIELAHLIKPKHTCLTHVSHAMGRHAEVSALLPEGFSLGYDQKVLNF